MYRKDEIEALRKREEELVKKIASLKSEFIIKTEQLKLEYDRKVSDAKKELRTVRKPLHTRDSYERNYGPVTEPQPRKTKEELREYNRIKQREYRAKRKKMMEE